MQLVGLSIKEGVHTNFNFTRYLYLFYKNCVFIRLKLVQSLQIFVEIFMSMQNISVKWIRISPAELSTTCCGQFFAFSKNDNIVYFSVMDKNCFFTKVIQTCAVANLSIYEVDIWIGYLVDNELSLATLNYDSEELKNQLTKRFKVNDFEDEMYDRLKLTRQKSIHLSA